MAKATSDKIDYVLVFENRGFGQDASGSIPCSPSLFVRKNMVIDYDHCLGATSSKWVPYSKRLGAWEEKSAAAFKYKELIPRLEGKRPDDIKHKCLIADVDPSGRTNFFYMRNRYDRTD